MNATIRNLLFVALMLLGLAPAMAQDGEWPRTIALDNGASVTVYEPQVEEMDESFVSFRAALAYRDEEGAEPVFGAGWFESEIQVDRFSRTAHPVGLKVTQTRFPMEADVQKRLGDAMALPGFAANFSFSLDALEASRQAAEAEALAAEKLNNTPPKIIYRDRPALLVTIDGEPVIRDIEDSDYQAVINTPYPLVRDGRRYYLNVAKDAWYEAPQATGPYRFVSDPPADVAALVKPVEGSDAVDEAANSPEITAANAPEIVVSTEPAELIVTEGPAAFVPLVDDLLVLNNSDDDVFMHTGEQRYYIVLSGRWYQSPSLEGPWEFRDSAELPEAFARIPDESEQADARVYVAGTQEAEQAVLDAQVPQTAAVQRGEADVDVQYDGEPSFEKVDGTDMVYAANSGSTVLYSDGLYYLVEDGVWYVSTQPEGPWQVAVARPDQVRVILPTSPVYPVKYVYIYDYTPDVVYVGYTPGYLGSYVYGPTIVYGSGWYYRPWVSHRYYYPRRSTWGFRVSYNPWYGWNFGLSWGWGPFDFTYWTGGYWHQRHHWYHRHYSYWGPHGYRPRHHYHRPPGHGGGHRPHPYQRHSNLYADSRQRAPVRRTRDREPGLWDRRAQRASFADKMPLSKDKRYKSNVRDKAAYASGAALGRKDLVRKARKAETGLARSKSKAVPAKRYASRSGQKPAGAVSRGAMESKAKSIPAAKQPPKRFARDGAKTTPDKQIVSRKSLERKAGSARQTTKYDARRSYDRQKARENTWAANRARSKGDRPTTNTRPVAPTQRSLPGGARVKAPLPNRVAGKPDRQKATSKPIRKAVTSPRVRTSQTAAKRVVRSGQKSNPSAATGYRMPRSMPPVKLTSRSAPKAPASRPANRPAPKAAPRPQRRYSHSAPAPAQRASPPPRQKSAPPSRNKSTRAKSRKDIK